MLGLGTTAPEVAAEGESGGSFQLEASQGDAAWRRRLSPSQRSAVRRFFSADE